MVDQIKEHQRTSITIQVYSSEVWSVMNIAQPTLLDQLITRCRVVTEKLTSHCDDQCGDDSSKASTTFQQNYGFLRSKTVNRSSHDSKGIYMH